MSRGPASATSVSTSWSESTSSRRRSAPLKPWSFSASRSVAHTRAPSRRNASAMACPMPCPAAVTRAVLPRNRSTMVSSHREIRSHALEHRTIDRHHPMLSLFCRAASCGRKTGSTFAHDALMIVPRHPEGLGDFLELHRRLQGHALRELIHHGALDLLPGGLARRIGIAAPGVKVIATPLQLLVGDQDVGAPQVEVDAD